MDLKTDLDEALWWGDLMSELKESTWRAYLNNRTWRGDLEGPPGERTWIVGLVSGLREETRWVNLALRIKVSTVT